MIPITAVARSGFSTAITDPVRVITVIAAKKMVPARPCRRPPLRSVSAAAPESRAALPAVIWINMTGLTHTSLVLVRHWRIMWIIQLLAMTRRAKDMIAGCIEKMRAQDCGNCDHRNDCAFIVPELLGRLFQPAPPRGERPPERRGGFLRMLFDEIAGAARREMAKKGNGFRRRVE